MGIGLTYEQLAQVGHILGGCFLVYHFGRWSKKPWHILAMVVLLASFKEFFLDYNYEDVVTRGSDIIDFCFWCLGAFSGMTLLYLDSDKKST